MATLRPPGNENPWQGRLRSRRAALVMPAIANPRYINHAVPDHLLSQPRPRRCARYSTQCADWRGNIHIVFDPLPFEHQLLEDIERYDWPPDGEWSSAPTPEERAHIKEVNGWHHPQRQWLQDW